MKFFPPPHFIYGLILSLTLFSPSSHAVQVSFKRIFPDLRLKETIYLTSAPGLPKRVFIVEKRGTILSVEVIPNHSPTLSKPFLDISSKVLNSGEQGLLGLAFDPEYAKNGYFYVNYVVSMPTRRTVISRFTASSPDRLSADAQSEKILLTIEQPYPNHKGGMLAFGLDKKLYIGLGDGGSGGDPHGYGQDRTSLLGKILRIDPHLSAPYAPKDNPYFGNTQGWKPEIWAYGLRNPWRFSFDRKTGELWVGDVGQNKYEEIALVRKGDNHGWNRYEGFHTFKDTKPIESSGTVAPIHEYGHDAAGGISVTGGYVYRGADIPELQGQYIYGDFGSRRVWALVSQNGKKISNTEIAQIENLASFGEDALGELYAISLTGAIYRLMQEQNP